MVGTLAMASKPIRIGTDLVSIERLERAIDRAPGLLNMVFTESELAAADLLQGKRRSEFLAARFAVKEATLKALRTGIEDRDSMRYVETLRRPDGSPCLKLYGPAADRAAALHLGTSDVSISHEGDLVVAFVTLAEEQNA